MDDVDLLAGILAKTGDVVANTRDDQWDQPTPCPDFTVRALLAHIGGWVQVFDAAANGHRFDGDPTAYVVTEGSADDFRGHALSMVDGWRDHGLDRTVPMMGGDLPASMVFGMTFMEYVTHGWDLAVATGQPVPYTDAEVTETLRRAHETLQPQFRGDQIGPEVDVPADAPVLDRLVAFMGRRP